MADLLFMSQSQYQRRECGDIRISDDEFKKTTATVQIKHYFYQSLGRRYKYNSTVCATGGRNNNLLRA